MCAQMQPAYQQLSELFDIASQEIKRLYETA